MERMVISHKPTKTKTLDSDLYKYPKTLIAFSVFHPQQKCRSEVSSSFVSLFLRFLALSKLIFLYDFLFGYRESSTKTREIFFAFCLFLLL